MPKPTASSSASTSKGKQPEVLYPKLPVIPEIFLPDQTLGSTELGIKHEYDALRRENDDHKKQDRRVSFAGFGIDEEDTGFSVDNLSEQEFTAAFEKNPGHFFRLTSELSKLARHSLTEADVLHRANAANLAKLSYTQDQVAEQENELELLRHEVSKHKEDANMWRAEAKRRSDMIDTYKKLNDDLELKNVQFQRERSEPQDRSAPVVSPRLTSNPTDVKSHVTRAASTFTDPDQEKVIITDKATPNPAPFSGQDKDYTINAFVRALEPKLAVTTFRTDKDGLQFVLNLLKGSAWRLCNSRVPATLARGTCYNPFSNIEEMIDELYKRFGTVNTEGEALLAIRQLRQGPNQTFASLHARFLEYRSQLPHLSDAMEMDMLHGMLNETYLLKFASQSPCHTAKEMVEHLTHLDTQLKKTKIILASSTTSTSGSTRRSEPKTRSNTPTTAPGTRSLSSEDLPEKYRNLPHLTPELRVKLIQENKCLRCRGPGHRQTEAVCPLYNYGRPELAVRSAEAVSESSGKEETTA